MKKLLLLLLFPFCLSAQDVAISYTLSSDTLLFGNTLILKIVVENADLGNTLLDFKDFDYVNPPSTTSQISIINGDRTNKMSYNYYLQAKREGDLFIEPLTIEDDEGNFLSTDPINIFVLPNPEGIIEEPKLENNGDSFFFDFGDPFKNNPFRTAPIDPNAPKKKKPKKRRPTYKI